MNKYRCIPGLQLLENRTLLAVVTNTDDSGPGSLRAALASSIGGGTISFDIDVARYGNVINLLSPLPVLSSDITIDGRTQKGYAGTPIIQIDGSSLPHVDNEWAALDGFFVAGSHCVIAGLSITNFAGSGIRIADYSNSPGSAEGNRILANYIGVDPGGLVAGPNGEGVIVAGGGDNVIGTDGDGVGDASEGNVISGNSGIGVQMIGTHGTVVAGNMVRGNGGDGIDLSLAHDNRIGTNADGTSDDLERNVISGNEQNGIFICTEGTTDNVIAGNYIGTDAEGSHPLGNEGAGVLITKGASYNTIGGTAAASANVISGNATPGKDPVSGVDIWETGTRGNVVEGNFIGTDALGRLPLGNAGAGLTIGGGASDNTIGGTVSGAGNTISGNGPDDDDESDHGYAGVELYGSGTSHNLIAGNFIGTDKAGTKALGNSNGGVLLAAAASYNTIGGPTAHAKNLISGNEKDDREPLGGVTLFGDLTRANLIEGNLIGTDFTGQKSLGNWGGGVKLTNGPSGNTIGGDGEGAGNLISGNNGDGVDIEDILTAANVVQGNLIGSDLTGSRALPNSGDGVVIHVGSSYNTIGGTTAGARNIIAFNGVNGVTIGRGNIDTSGGDTIEGNLIFGNQKMGIDLGDDGSTANYPAGGGDGPNHWQPYPTLHPPDLSGAIMADLQARPGVYRIEFFANLMESPGGLPQGQSFLGSASLIVGTNGRGSVAFSLPADASPGAIITATATSSAGDTSEFDADEPLDWVTFGGDGFCPISSDVDPSLTYGAQQWLVGENPHQWPVLYAAGSTLTVSAEWTKIASLPDPDRILAKATISNGLTPLDDLTISPTKVAEQAGKLLLPPASLADGSSNPEAARANHPFGNSARYFSDFIIHWKLSFDGGSSWIDAGMSRNPLYVSASTAPQPDPESRRFFVTVVDSEINATSGLSMDSQSGDRAAIIADTWSLFSSLSVRQFSPLHPFSGGSEQGRRLTYYGTPASGNAIEDTTQQITFDGFTRVTTVQELLEGGDGECMTFSKLFLDMLLVDGVTQSRDLITVTPSHSDGFLVNNWTFTGAGTGDDPAYPYVDVAAHEAYEVLKQPGVAGQNSSDPAAFFNNHVIALIDGLYYDPSYGKTYESLVDMANQDVAGYYRTRWRFSLSDFYYYETDIQKPGATSDSLKIRSAVTWTVAGLSGSSGGGALPRRDLVGELVSTVGPLAPSTAATRFTVSMTGASDRGGADVRSFALFVSTDGGPFELDQAGIPAQAATGLLFTGSTTFAGSPGHSYSFYSVATDVEGNVENAHAWADATVTILETAVVLAPIPAQSAVVGQTFWLDVSRFASDGNSPPRPLTYSLEPGDLRGMSINPTTGLLSWPVSLVQKIGTYTITVEVSDSTSTARSVSELINILVVDPGPPLKITASKVTQKRGLSITLKFNQPLDPATATNPDNYILAAAMHKHISKKKQAASTRIEMIASYDQARNQVTLKASGAVRIRSVLTLTVVETGSSGVAKLDGSKLAGSNGRPGTDYVAKVTKNAVRPAVAVRNQVILRRDVAQRPEVRPRGVAVAGVRFLSRSPSSADSGEVALWHPSGPIALSRSSAKRKAARILGQ